MWNFQDLFAFVSYLLISVGLVLQERSRIMLKFADLVEKHNDELAALETWDNGKPYLQAAEAEVPSFVRLFRYYAGNDTLQTRS